MGDRGGRNCRWVLAAGKSEFGLCGVVGGMMVIELLAGTMKRWPLGRMIEWMRGMRGGELAVECCECQQMANKRGERNGECDYIRHV